jgi:hypothetical protein
MDKEDEGVDENEDKDGREMGGRSEEEEEEEEEEEWGGKEKGVVV